MNHNDHVYRKIYEEHFGIIPIDSEGRTYEVHHKDGNPDNNDPSNLVALSIQEHYEVHYQQEDWAACLLICTRMEISVQERSELARKQQIERSKKGIHHFLGGKIQSSLAKRLVEEGTHNFLGGEIQRESNQQRVENGTHHLLGPSANQYLLDTGQHPSQKKIECPHCGKVVDCANYKRWHGENCKAKEK